MTNRLIIFAAFQIFILGSSHADLSSAKWEYLTVLGQKSTFYSSKGILSAQSGDVTEVDVSCSADHLQVCVVADILLFSIPKKNPIVGEQWKANNASFSLIKLRSSITILGNEYRDLYIVKAIRVFPDQTESKFYYVAGYTYDQGLVFFYKETGEGGADLGWFSKGVKGIGAVGG